MNRFSSLLKARTDVTPGAQQVEAARLLPTLIADGPLNWWGPGSPVVRRGERLLVGVAPYSLPDLDLLDALYEDLVTRKEARLQVDVFDTLSCRRMSDFEAYIPGLGNVYQTPVVGFWRDGVLQELAQGYYGRALVWKTLGRAPVAAP